MESTQSSPANGCVKLNEPQGQGEAVKRLRANQSVMIAVSGDELRVY